MKYLIINADDFGYSYSVNEGIVEAHTRGVVTSTSVLVDAIAAAEAKELARYPGLSVGLHFAVSDFNNVDEEFERQLQKFTAITGKSPDHIDTHKIHSTEQGFKKVLTSFSKQHKVPVRGYGYAKFIDSFFGMHTAGDVSLEMFRKAVDAATDEFNEIMCHVGYSDGYLRAHSSYNDMREQELKTICSTEARQYLEDKGLACCSWKQVPID